MEASRIRRMVGVLVVATALGAVGRVSGAEAVVKPLAGHPGNVFLAGEKVVVGVEGQGGAYGVMDYEGREVRRGQVVDGKADLGELGVGYYELKAGEGKVVSVGVIERLTAKTPATSPIGIDVAMAWFYGEKQMPAVANLCALAGMNWVRDRLSWPEMEPRKGEFSGANRYDASARIQAAAGLRVLQVAHISPGWTKSEAKRFPPDLRDAYAFWKEMARRWKGQVLAFEPWNEADIDVFGGHTGAEMAAMQKASYLGLKAGNPEVIGSLNVFAINRKATLEDLDANEAWPYFDTCNLHHYIPLAQYPGWYGSFRAISGGRPLWVTEFSMPVQWADEKTHEPSEADLRVQAERVPMVYAAALHEGVEAAFYFLLPHYVEGRTQFGILRKDLTPRPAYLAAAAAGRLLADAKAMGRSQDGEVWMYAFRARPDGRERNVRVMWSKEEKAVRVGDGEAYDHLGRPVAVVDGMVKVRKPVYVVGPVAEIEGLGFAASPRMPERKSGKASPIVLQALLPEARTELARSAYRISSAQVERIPVYAYNFGEKAAKGKLVVKGPERWKVGIAGEVEIVPGERKELALSIDCNGAARRLIEAIRVEGDFGEAGRAVMSVRVVAEPRVAEAAEVSVIGGAEDVARWAKEVSGGSKLELSVGVKVEATLGPGDRWVYPRLDLLQHERAGKDARELRFKVTVHEGKGRMRVILVEDGGACYVGELTRQPELGKGTEVSVLLDEAVIGMGWSPADANGRLNPEQVKAIKIGWNATSERVSYTVSEVKWVRAGQ